MYMVGAKDDKQKRERVIFVERYKKGESEKSKKAIKKASRNSQNKLIKIMKKFLCRLKGIPPVLHGQADKKEV